MKIRVLKPNNSGKIMIMINMSGKHQLNEMWYSVYTFEKEAYPQNFEKEIFFF